MNRKLIQITSILLLALMLSACGKKAETVPEVSKAFWDAVIANDEYSTLENEEEFDRFGREWQNMLPSWGQIVIDADEARVNTQVSTPDGTGAGMLFFVTYLIKTDDGWVVDYERTGKGVSASGVVVDFVDKITTLGEDIRRQFEKTSENVAIEMATIVEQLDQMTEQYQDQADSAIESTANSMRKLLDEFADSLEKAMEEIQGPGITETNQTDMKESVDRLQSSSKELANPSLDAIANSGQQVIVVTEKLARITDEKLDKYAEQWEKILVQFEAEMERLIAHFNGEEAAAVE
jgi:vacuolar-type H+-ATPase subunit F/Vma7/low affinity Fe/Cu permease